MADSIYYERNLPHYQPHDAWYLVNIRLAGSLPNVALRQIQQDFEAYKSELASLPQATRNTSEYRDRQFKYFVDVDTLLHGAACSPRWLQRRDIAEIVAHAIRHYDQDDFDLLSYCVMPNHVQIVFALGSARMAEYPLREEDTAQSAEIPFPVTRLIGSIKQYTARRANAILRRQGKFWQHESCDHVIRTPEELERLLRYVLNNPVAAGLAEEWREWEWTYLKEGLL